MPDSFGSNPVGEPVQPCSATAQTEKHWIEIQLLGEDDSPVPDEEYRIVLPNGDQARGYLDSKGCARIENIPQGGDCQITFPVLDKDAWEPIG
ncbi:MAG: hypothetical protein WBY44_16965 [Bryobacteraceae bacterium]|jgi:hypothetical protein